MDELGSLFAAVSLIENKLTYASLKTLSAVCGWPEPVKREEEATYAEREGRAKTQPASGRRGQPAGEDESPRKTRRKTTAIFERLKGQLAHPDAVEKALLQLSDGALAECFPDSEEETLRKLGLFDKDEPHASKTPPTHVFAAWLSQNKPSVPLSHKLALDFVEEAPISTVNKEFLRDNLRAVPEVCQGQLNCPVELHSVFPRPDFVKIFEKLYNQGVHLCLAQGLRRFGKSLSILEAVLTVRAKKRAHRDRVVFFWDGTGNRPSNFKIIFAVLNCMGVLAIIDEFQEHLEAARDLKGFVEAPGLGRPGSPLQFVFFGSNQEKVILQKKWFNAIDGAGVKVAVVTLPPTPVGLLRLHNKQASGLSSE